MPYFCRAVKQMASISIDFLNDILGRISKSDEKESFAIQNTLYALLIFLQAGLAEEAAYAKGRLGIDGKTYDSSGGIFPAALIADYGFWSGPEGYHLETAKLVFWPFIGIMMDEQEGALKAIIARMDEVMSQLEDTGRNYYTAAMDTAILEGERLERACRLFGLPLPAVAVAVDTSSQVSAVPAVADSASPPAHAKKPATYKHTRRVHGRRALTPPRTGRGTAFTRHKPRSAT